MTEEGFSLTVTRRKREAEADRRRMLKEGYTTVEITKEDGDYFIAGTNKRIKAR